MLGVRGRGVFLAMLAALAVAVPGSASRQAVRAGVFTGYGFDACSAPAVSTLQAWAASPYRALGVYIGGANRACAQPNLTSSWVSTVTGLGWSLLPLYVGLQAPCVGQSGLKTISTTTATAASQGRAAADDAAAQATSLALPGGSPVWFDMEGYKVGNASCTAAVQSFVTAWSTQLRTYGFVPGVYGSAASTVKDVAALGTGKPDVIWIANWNGVEGVFGDPYVSDTQWPSHQRVHQYRGGHRETWGNATINIDNDYVDSVAVNLGGAAPPPPPPPPSVGQVNSGDGLAIVSWPANAFTVPVVVTLTPTSQPPTSDGYAVKLAVSEQETTAPVDGFGAPVTLHILKPANGLLPVFSADGTSWKPLPKLSAAGLGSSVLSAYTMLGDGTVAVQTLVPGYFGLLADTVPPTTPPAFAGRMVNGALVLSWQGSTDDSGQVAGYDVLLDGDPVSTLKPTMRRVTVRNFHAGRTTVYRLKAVDGAGNLSKATPPIVVRPARRPAGLPKTIPHWAFGLYTWQHTHAGARPAAAPKRPPTWYWRWAAWRAAPFQLRR